MSQKDFRETSQKILTYLADRLIPILQWTNTLPPDNRQFYNTEVIQWTNTLPPDNRQFYNTEVIQWINS